MEGMSKPFDCVGRNKVECYTIPILVRIDKDKIKVECECVIHKVRFFVPIMNEEYYQGNIALPAGMIIRGLADYPYVELKQ